MLIRVRVRVRGRVRVRARVGLGVGLGVGSPSWFTRSVSQPFLGLKDERIFQQQQQQQQQQQATEHISAYPHICVSIDGTSPKLSWYIVLMMPYKHTGSFRSKHTKGQGWWAKKS